MKRQYFIAFLPILLLVAVVCKFFSPSSELLIDGRLKLGQSENEVHRALSELGYIEDVSARKSHEMIFLKEKGDPWTKPFIRVDLTKDGRVRALSGRMQQIKIDDVMSVTNQTTKEGIKSILGEPSWESRMKSPVYRNSYGLCYEALDLYILLSNDKAISFSWGKTPQKPSKLYVEP